MRHTHSRKQLLLCALTTKIPKEKYVAECSLCPHTSTRQVKVKWNDVSHELNRDGMVFFFAKLFYSLFLYLQCNVRNKKNSFWKQWKPRGGLKPLFMASQFSVVVLFQCPLAPMQWVPQPSFDWPALFDTWSRALFAVEYSFPYFWSSVMIGNQRRCLSLVVTSIYNFVSCPTKFFAG